MRKASEEVRLFRLGSSKISVEVLNLGALLHSVTLADRHGRPVDVVLGFDHLGEYAGAHPNFGLTVGRVANRIRNATFTLDGTVYTLKANNGAHHLHGGPQGFGRCFWTPEYVDDTSVTFHLFSPDGDEGYPGNLNTTLTYSVVGNALILDYAAASDKPTPVNLSNHAYFNLNGGENAVLNHRVTLSASRRVDVDETLIPTGKLVDVAGTAYDFRSSKSIAEGLGELGSDQGFDLCYVLDPIGESLPKVAEIFGPDTGIVMEVFTSEPGMQFYTANFLDGRIKGKNNTPYTKHFGLCLEAQKFPDSPNNPSFPDITLRPGDLLRSRTIYTFSVRD